MNLVYKKDGFIVKLFACFFVAIFVVMFFVGNSVFASFNFIGSDNNNYNLPDFPNVEYNNFIICDSIDGNYINLFLLSSNDNVLLDYNTNTNVSFAYRSGYRYKIPSNCEGDWVFVSDLSTSDSSFRYGFTCNTLLYTSVDIFDYSGNIIIQSNSQSSERGTGSSSDSGGSGNETSGGDTNTTTDSDDSGGFLSSITQGISNIIQFFKDIIGFIGNILSYLNPLDDNFILKGVIEFLGNILDYLNPFSDNFILKSVLDFLGNVLSYINPFSENFFGYKIIDLLKSALQWLFVPSEERITALHNTVTSKFDFVTTIKTASDSMKNLIENTGNAPKLKIRTFKTKYTNEQEQVILDFSWYAPFKAYGDAIITGFVYALFFWRLFISVPNIIKGNAGVVNDVEFIKYVNSGKG